MGALAKQHTEVFCYYPPNRYQCSPSAVLCALKDLKCMFTAIGSTVDGLTVLGETESR